MFWKALLSCRKTLAGRRRTRWSCSRRDACRHLLGPCLELMISTNNIICSACSESEDTCEMLRTRLQQCELNPCHDYSASNIYQPVVPLYRRRSAHPTSIPPPSCGHRLHVGLEEALLVRSTSLTRKGDEKTPSRIAPALSWVPVRVTKRKNGVTVTSPAFSLTKQS